MPNAVFRFEQCCWEVRGILAQLGPDEVCCEGLTPRQCRVLRALGEDPERNLTALAEREGLTPSGMSRRVDPLVEAGYLVRARGQGPDGRALRLDLTPRGETALRSVEDQIYGGIQALWDALPAGKRAGVLAALEQFVQAARRAEARPAQRARPKRKKETAS
jgi:DNA-binding MarR family transcriptional regulator